MDACTLAAASGRCLAPWDASGSRLDAGGMAPECWRRPGRTQRPTGIAGVLPESLASRCLVLALGLSKIVPDDYSNSNKFILIFDFPAGELFTFQGFVK